MLRVAVLVSGGGTNLQAIIDAVENGTITNTELVGVISNNKNAYALTRAGNHQIPAQCVSPKDFETREEFNKVRRTETGSDRSGGIFGCDPGRNDQQIPE